MNVIKVNHWPEIPENFTGITEYPDGTKEWYKEGKYHREDGPAIEYPNGEKRWYKEGNYHRENGPAIEHPNGTKYWFLNGINYTEINLNDYVVLDFYQGPYNLMWYKILTKNKVVEYPDIPGLIEK